MCTVGHVYYSFFLTFRWACFLTETSDENTISVNSSVEILFHAFMSDVKKIYRWWLFVFWFWLTAISVLRGLYFYVGKKTSPETRLREGLRNYFFSFSLSYALGGDGVTSGLIHQQLRVNSHHGCLTGVPFSAFLSLPFEAVRENVQTELRLGGLRNVCFLWGY